MDDRPENELHPDAAELLKHWRALTNVNGLPSLTQEVEDGLQRWMHDLSIIELHDGPQRYFVRHHGCSTQLRIGDNMTGLYFEEVLPPIVRMMALAPYEEAVRHKLPTRSTMVSKLYRGIFKQLDRLVLPFGDDDQVTSFVTWVGTTERCPAAKECVYDYISALTDPNTGAKDLVSLRVLST